MITVISPAKSLDFESPSATKQYSQPEFLAQSQQLIDQLQVLEPKDIASLMKLSDKLAALNFDRFQSFKTPFTQDNAKQAGFAFRGDVYQGLDFDSLSKNDFEFAQNHLRILSGLYGLLKPLDLMQAYRLEMGTKFENNAGKNLYDFWGLTINQKIDELLAEQSSSTLINLASNEYFKAVKAKLLNHTVITPVFKDFKSGKYKIVSFYAKKARGLMARYIIENKIEQPEKIKKFNVAGYYFDEASSTDTDWVFLRDEPA